MGNSADFDLLKPSAPFRPLKRVKPVSDVNLIDGIRPPQLAGIEWAVSLPPSLPPKSLETLLTSKNRAAIKDALKKIWLPQPPLSVDTYARQFRVLLHLEELQMKYVLCIRCIDFY